MPQLPDRPDLDQLRRQARELLRAAQDGDPAALRRLQAVSDKATLSTAQLALAREYGFPGWHRLADDVERRRAALEDPERSAPESAVPAPPESAVPAPPKSWQEVTEWSAGLLAADADELIAGQYADRPGLRPVLDAVLAALPPFGPVTVQARKTIVSLVSPRRTFAAVQATTKSRVDLGLRLVDVKPEGRLLAARNINVGAVNLMVALTGPGEVDEEVLGWLRRAYDESIGPAAPRRPARRPGPALGTLIVLIEGSDLPGRTWCPGPDGPAYQNVHVALHGHDDGRSFLPMPGRGGWLATEPVPADAPSARWEMPVTVRQGDAGLDFGGPFVRGDRTDRHIALAWGEVPGDGTLRLFRACKFGLAGVDPGLVEDALRPGRRLVARVRLTGARGNPGCADLAWSVERAP
jgi:Family of unknown function (DUF5990)/Domain of unknown function (DUF5655)